MNKAELVSAVAQEANLTKVAAGEAVNAVFSAITNAMAKGDSVQITGFGTFEVRTRAARDGINPSTREAVVIPEKTVPAFKAGKLLKEAVAGK